MGLFNIVERQAWVDNYLTIKCAFLRPGECVKIAIFASFYSLDFASEVVRMAQIASKVQHFPSSYENQRLIETIKHVIKETQMSTKQKHLNKEVQMLTTKIQMLTNKVQIVTKNIQTNMKHVQLLIKEIQRLTKQIQMLTNEVQISIKQFQMLTK